MPEQKFHFSDDRKKKIRWIVWAAVMLIAVPGLAITVGDSRTDSVQNGTGDVVTEWRNARTAYRIARISPLFWPTLANREHMVDMALSAAYQQEVISGDVPDHSAHVAFLESRKLDDNWWAPRLETLIRYGELQTVLEDVSSNGNETELRLATAAALAAGDAEAFADWLTHWGKIASPPPGLWLLANQPQNIVDADPLLMAVALLRQGSPEAAIEALKDWTPSEEADRARRAEVWAMALESQGAPPSEALRNELSGADDDLTWMGAWLSMTTLEPTPTTIDRILKCAQGLPQLRNRYELVDWESGLPHPNRFDTAINSANPEQQYALVILQAEAHLQLFDIASAQAALRKADGLQPTNEEWHSRYYMLRSLSRELSADLSGAMRYADLGLELNKANFKLLKARLLLLEHRRTEPISLLDSLNYYTLTESMTSEHSDLNEVTGRLNGALTPFSLNGLEIGSDLFVNDAVFREWFASYISIIGNGKRSLALPMLRFWRGAQKHGNFLITVRTGDLITITDSIVRSHLFFMHGALMNSDSSGWSGLQTSLHWLQDEPLPWLLNRDEWFAISITTQ